MYVGSYHTLDRARVSYVYVAQRGCALKVTTGRMGDRRGWTLREDWHSKRTGAQRGRALREDRRSGRTGLGEDGRHGRTGARRGRRSERTGARRGRASCVVELSLAHYLLYWRNNTHNLCQLTLFIPKSFLP